MYCDAMWCDLVIDIVPKEKALMINRKIGNKNEDA